MACFNQAKKPGTLFVEVVICDMIYFLKLNEMNYSNRIVAI